MVGVTIAHGGVYFNMAQAAAASVAKYAAIPVFIITAGKDKIAKWWKHELFEYFPNQTIFYFDADTLMLKPADLLQFDDKVEFIAVNDQYIDMHTDVKALNLESSTYFNSGIMIFNQRHKQIASWIDNRRIYNPLNTKFIDQDYWNMAVKELNIPLQLIDKNWNYLRYHPRHAPESVIIGHYTVQKGKRCNIRILETV